MVARVQYSIATEIGIKFINGNKTWIQFRLQTLGKRSNPF
jgi:hypothetical protein